MSHNIDFSYLRPPSKAQLIQHPQGYVMKVENGQHKRKIFHLVDWMEYDNFEKQSLKEFKEYLRKEGFDITFTDALYIRFLYAGDFNLQECTRRLRIYDEWQRDPNMQNLTYRAKEILETGVVYSYGRDPMYRPIIFLNVGKTDLSKFTVQDYFCAFNNLLKPVIQYMFIPGKVQNWIMVIDTGGKLFLPVNLLQNIIKKLSVVYSSCLQKLFVVNANYMVKIVYAAVKKLIHPDTQRKIAVLGSDEMAKMLESIAADELEQKYGGVLPNLTTYWPVQVTKNYAVEDAVSRRKYIEEFSTTPPDKMEESVYYSVLNDSTYFQQSAPMPSHIEKKSCSCCQSNSCLLF